MKTNLSRRILIVENRTIDEDAEKMRTVSSKHLNRSNKLLKCQMNSVTVEIQR